ncbi:hypothetical protein GCM10028784_39470 [Myceligenerans cantabricum]
MSADLSTLIVELRQAVRLASAGALVFIHVRQNDGHRLTVCDLLVLSGGPQERSIWSRVADVPAAVGATRRQVEHALAAAGHTYATSASGLRGAWRQVAAGSYLLRIHRDRPGQDR